MGTYLRIALRNLLQAKRRTFLLGFALAAVTLLLVVLMSVTRGLVENTVRQATTLMTGHVNVMGFYKTSPSDVIPIITEAPRVRAVIEAALPKDALVLDRMIGFGKLVGTTGSLMSMLSGVDAEREGRLRGAMRLAPESAYKEGGGPERKGDLAGLGRKGQLVLFAAQAKRLGVAPGDTVTLTAASQRGMANSAELVVAAVVEDIGLLSSFAAFSSREDLLDLYSARLDTTGVFMIYLRDIDDAAEAQGKVRLALADSGMQVLEPSAEPMAHRFMTLAGEDWTGQRADVMTWKEQVAFLDWIVTAFDTVSFLLIGVLLFIIAVGIMNAMWIAVRERTGEVGTLRAIGMHRRAVLTMFLTEALLLGAAATVTGAVAGTALTLAVDAAQVPLASEAARMVLLSDTLHLAPSFWPVFLSVVGFTAMTGLSALWPALRAARLQPVTAIQRVV